MAMKATKKRRGNRVRSRFVGNPYVQEFADQQINQAQQSPLVSYWYCTLRG